MTREEAEKYANNMTYRDAINNLMKARSIPYRKATFIKINELLKALKQEPILEKIFYIVHPLSIMSTDKLEHEAIMQIAEMLEPLYLLESEDKE